MLHTYALRDVLEENRVVGHSRSMGIREGSLVDPWAGLSVYM